MSNQLVLRFRPYNLQLTHAFTISSNSRTTTPVMLTELEFDGVVGYGEASLPPYLGEDHSSVAAFLSSLDLAQFKDPLMMEDILDYVDNRIPGNYAAKAAVDIALHDLIGKIKGQPLYKIWGLNPEETPYTSYTIGIDTPEMVRIKTEEAAPYKILKVKLGRENDKEIIEAIRSVTDKPLCVDVNQGWKDKHKALDMIHWLHEKGIIFIEQPMPKAAVDETAWLTSQSPIPIIADESLQTLKDIAALKDVFSGINIKLMKCGGLRAAHEMITLARSLGLKIMIGCMTETSCAVSAAAQLSPMADWADLDGNLLISNDLFDGVKVHLGKLVLSEKPGIGVIKI